VYTFNNGEFRYDIPGINTFDVSPDGSLLASVELGQDDFLTVLLSHLGFRSVFPLSGGSTIQIRRLEDGASLGNVPGYLLHWIQGRSAVATNDEEQSEVWRIFDIPPRKSLTWFAAGAALLALPIALVTWRRTRKLRAA
jgi:hypothetical protein